VFGEDELDADGADVDVEGRLDERDEVGDVSRYRCLQCGVFEDEVVDLEEVRVRVLACDAGERRFELFFVGEVSVVLSQRKQLALEVELLDLLEARQFASLSVVEEDVESFVLVTRCLR